MNGETIMLHPRRNRREKSRTLLILPVSIGLAYGEHQAVIRDISASGMFLFSTFTPPIGAEIELKMTPPTAPKCYRVTYRAIVVPSYEWSHRRSRRYRAEPGRHPPRNRLTELKRRSPAQRGG
jgi:PilZ domain